VACMNELQDVRVPAKDAEDLRAGARIWLGWIPLIVLPAAACFFRARLEP
jgi:hypothetical protein